MTLLTVLSKAEGYIFKGRGVFIDVYKADDKNVTSGSTSLADLNLRRTYRAIDNVATGRIPSLFCDYTILGCTDVLLFPPIGYTELLLSRYI